MGQREGMFQESENEFTEIQKDLLLHFGLETAAGVKG